MFNIRQAHDKTAYISSDILLPAKRNYKVMALKVILLALLAIAGFSVKLYSQTSGGGFAESYLMRDVGARAVGLGGAYTAIANEPDAVFYNPAGLGYFSNQPLVTTSFSSLGLGRNHSSIAWGQQVAEGLGLGIGFNSFSSGSFLARDVMGNPIGNFQDYQYSLTAAAAYKLEFASMGASVKYLNNNLLGSNTAASGVALDFGAKFDVMNMFSFGVSVQNLTGMMFWNTKGGDFESIPYTIRTGIAMEYGFNAQEYTSRSTTSGEIETVYIPATRYMLFGMDIVMRQNDVSPSYVAGLEAAVHEMISFRGGLALYGDKDGKPMILPMTNWGAGISIKPDLKNLFDEIPFKLRIDYTVAREYITESGISHNFSLMFEF